MKRHIGDVPALLAYRGELHAPGPTVLWFHGFGVDKETHRPELQMFAEAGLLAVGIDAAGHGERRRPDLQQLIDAPREQAHRSAVNLAVETAAEVPALVTTLIEEGLVDSERVALAGISMGAFVVYRALVECRSINRAVAILGAPKWPFAHSPHDELDAFCAAELLSITAECDENVPPIHARELHSRLDAVCPSRHAYLELPGAVHLMSAEHWVHTTNAMRRWLAPLTGE